MRTVREVADEILDGQEMDSLQQIMVIAALEEAFGVSFSMDEAVRLTTIEALEAAVASKLA